MAWFGIRIERSWPDQGDRKIKIWDPRNPGLGSSWADDGTTDPARNLSHWEQTVKGMDWVFDWCVDFLEWLAPLLGMSYKEINVWLFVIVMPGAILILVILRMYFWLRLRRLEARLRTSAEGLRCGL